MPSMEQNEVKNVSVEYVWKSKSELTSTDSNFIPSFIGRTSATLNGGSTKIHVLPWWTVLFYQRSKCFLASSVHQSILPKHFLNPDKFIRMMRIARYHPLPNEQREAVHLISPFRQSAELSCCDSRESVPWQYPLMASRDQRSGFPAVKVHSKLWQRLHNIPKSCSASLSYSITHQHREAIWDWLELHF